MPTRSGADYCGSIILQGIMARELGRRLTTCPHAKNSPERLLWRYGHKMQRLKKQSHVKQGGRGRGRDWTEDELALLDIAGDLPRETIAGALGRSPRAVMIKLSRLQEKEA